jgi:hypothetical protein
MLYQVEELCLGAPNKPYVPYYPCVEGSSCTDQDEEYGLKCSHIYGSAPTAYTSTVQEYTTAPPNYTTAPPPPKSTTAPPTYTTAPPKSTCSCAQAVVAPQDGNDFNSMEDFRNVKRTNGQFCSSLSCQMRGNAKLKLKTKLPIVLRDNDSGRHVDDNCKFSAPTVKLATYVISYSIQHF